MTTSTMPRPLSTNQQNVLSALNSAGTVGRTFDELQNTFHDLTPSRVRTIVSELVKVGLVRKSGQWAFSNRGRKQTIWVAV